MSDFDPPEGFRQTERLSGTLAALRQFGEWSRQGYGERRFAELKLTFVGPLRTPAPDPLVPNRPAPQLSAMQRLLSLDCAHPLAA